MGSESYIIIVLVAPALITIALARELVQEPGGKPPLFTNMFWTFGLACLFWIGVSAFILDKQLACVDPPDVVEWGCGMGWVLCTGPVLFTAAVVLLFSAGYMIVQYIKQRRQKALLDPDAALPPQNGQSKADS